VRGGLSGIHDKKHFVTNSENYYLPVFDTGTPKTITRSINATIMHHFMLLFYQLSESKKGYYTLRFLFFIALYCLVFLPSKQASAQCVFYTKIFASDDPFGSCPINTDMIIIRDTLVLDVSYAPLFGGVPFDGTLLVDGGILHWSNNVSLKLGALTCVRLIGGGHIYPENIAMPDCNAFKTLNFETLKYASCSGENALHAFSAVNVAGCANCCDSTLNFHESLGELDEIASVEVLAIPNPSAGDFILKTKVPFLMKSIEIVDISGYICDKFHNLNTNQFEIKRNNLAPGVYFVRIMSNVGMVTKKVVLY